MIELLVSLLILVLVLGVIYYIITLFPMDERFRKAALAVVLVIGLIALIYILLGVAGHAPSLNLR